MLEISQIHRLRAVLAIQMAVIVALVLFNVWLLKRPRPKMPPSLVENTVFSSTIADIRRDIKEVRDVRTTLAQKPFKIRKAVPISWMAHFNTRSYSWDKSKRYWPIEEETAMIGMVKQWHAQIVDRWPSVNDMFDLEKMSKK